MLSCKLLNNNTVASRSSVQAFIAGACIRMNAQDHKSRAQHRFQHNKSTSRRHCQRIKCRYWHYTSWHIAAQSLCRVHAVTSGHQHRNNVHHAAAALSCQRLAPAALACCIQGSTPWTKPAQIKISSWMSHHNETTPDLHLPGITKAVMSAMQYFQQGTLCIHG